MGTSKRYNSIPVKDNCMLFAPIPLFSGPYYPMMSLKFFPCQPLLPRQRILGNGLSDGVIKIFRLLTPVAIATNFGTKLTTTQPL